MVPPIRFRPRFVRCFNWLLSATQQLMIPKVFAPWNALTWRLSSTMATSATQTNDVQWVPFKTDCEDLLGRFLQTDSVRFEDFAAVWRVMDFSSVFYGMTTNQEKRPFSRLIFTTVYDYFLPPYSFQIRVGALYMLYSLYFTQLACPREKICIALKDWMTIQQFVSDALSCQHLDVVYVYRKLVSEKALFYSALPYQLTFDGKRRYKNKISNESFKDRPVRVMELVNAGTLEEITNVQTHYERIKQAIHVTASISVTPVNLTVQLQECALEFQQWQENKRRKNKNPGTKVKESTPPLESTTRADLLATIKAKSYERLTRASKSRHGRVEMDTSGSGTDNTPEVVSPQKRRQLSLRQRTWQSLGKTECDEQRRQLQWLLSKTEEDTAAIMKCPPKKVFKW